MVPMKGMQKLKKKNVEMKIAKKNKMFEIIL